LRDRARADYINSPDWILDSEFQSLQKIILYNMVVSAVATSLFAILELLTAVNPMWLKVCLVAQIMIAILLVCTGGYVADHVHGYQSFFERFRAGDNIPYYSVIYYGCVCQAVYGVVLIFVTISPVFIFTACEEVTSGRGVRGCW
jgi:hypothetical protein